jgi:RES domain-containing protein
MLLYRITRKKHAQALDGAGSRINGGRWNNIGTPCIYTSESRALAVLEYIVNMQLDEVPLDLVVISLKIANEKEIYKPAKLPENWMNIKASDETKQLGTSILNQKEHLIIKIPSVIIPEEYNYLINPEHSHMKNLSIVNVAPFSFDTRLKK